jgi:nanoRNase/pAp phosphatase (c-di-AMP/oligoRNAs hydrolase)
MRPLPRPEVILTHESDLDGLLSGLLLQRLARKLFEAEIPLQAYHYNHWKVREIREKSAWVADFTFEARLDRPDWLVVDHHPTEVIPKEAELVHDISKSAGLLVYELCVEHGLGSPELDRLVHLNNVSDLFLQESPEFLEANDYANLVKTYQFWNLHALIDGCPEKLLNHSLLEVMAVKRRIEDPLGYEWSKENVVRLNETVGFVETIIGNTNMIVHQLLERQDTPFPVLITLFRRPNNVIIASFRSRNGEALKTAEVFQGGGHPNACGATLPRSIRTIPDAVDYLRQILNPVKEVPLNGLDGLFASAEASRK